MDIAFVDPYKLEYYGGLEKLVHDISIYLKSKGHNITIYSLNRGFPRSNELPSIVKSKGIEYKVLKTIPHTCIFEPILRRHDIIYFAQMLLGAEFYIPIIKRLHKLTKFIVGFHTPPLFKENYGVLKDILPPPKLVQQRNSIKMLYEMIFGTKGMRLFKHYDGYHVNNRFFSKLLSYYGYDAKKIYHIPNPIFFNQYVRDGEKFEKFTVLFAQRLDYDKGADRIPEIVKAFKEDEVDFIIIGKGEYSDTITELAKSRRNVEYLGFVDTNLKHEVLHKSHVLAVPSRGDTFNLSALEALASGTPVVSMWVPGVEDYLVTYDNGYLSIDIRDMVYGIRFIKKLWLEGMPYRQMVRRAIETARILDMENVGVLFERMLYEVLNGEATLF